MVLLQYFKLKKERQHLPDPNGPLSCKVPSFGISAANAYVSKLLDSKTSDASNGECSLTATSGLYSVFIPAQKYVRDRLERNLGTGLRTSTKTKLRNRFTAPHLQSHH